MYFVLGRASFASLTSAEAETFLGRGSTWFGQGTVHFGQVADLFRRLAHREDACKSFLIMLMCALNKDTFELTRHHCKSSEGLQRFKSQPWYQFDPVVQFGAEPVVLADAEVAQPPTILARLTVSLRVVCR